IEEQWTQLRAELDAEYVSAKDAQGAVIALSEKYRELSDSDRAAVDLVICRWVLSSDESTRFGALALIWDHNIESALPNLRVLSHRLQEDWRAGAPYERAKALRLIARLSSSASNA